MDELTGLVDRLRRDRRAHPYRGRREYSQAARDLADRCEALIDAGAAATAVPVLRKAVDRMTSALTSMDDSSNGGDKHRYRRALPLLSALQAVCRAAGQDDRFAAYLVGFRDRHRRRPTLMKTLDGGGFRVG